MTRSEVLLRRGLLALAALATAGIAIELAVGRHWRDWVQLIPWYAVAALTAAIALAALSRDQRWAGAARWLAAAVVIASAYGIYQHVAVNLDSGALDGLHGPTWDSLSWPRQLWLAVSKTVGPTPPFAPGVLAQAALLVLLATWRRRDLADVPTTRSR